jgi:hypothetical protein
MPPGFQNMGGIQIENRDPAAHADFQQVGAGGTGSVGQGPQGPANAFMRPFIPKTTPTQQVTGTKLAQSPVEGQDVAAPAQPQPSPQDQAQAAMNAQAAPPPEGADINVPPNPRAQVQNAAATGIGNLGKGFISGFRQGAAGGLDGSRLGQGLDRLQQQWDSGKGFVEGIKDVAGAGLNSLKDAASNAWQARTSPQGSWTQAAGRAGQTAGRWATAGAQKVMDGAGAVADSLNRGIDAAKNTAVPMFANAMGRVGQGLSSLRDKYQEWKNRRDPEYLGNYQTKDYDPRFADYLQEQGSPVGDYLKQIQNFPEGRGNYIFQQPNYERAMRRIANSPEGKAAGYQPRNIRDMMDSGMSPAKIQRQISKDILQFTGHGGTKIGNQNPRQVNYHKVRHALFPEEYGNANMPDYKDVVRGLKAGIEIGRPGDVVGDGDDINQMYDNPSERYQAKRVDEVRQRGLQSAAHHRRRYNAPADFVRGADEREYMGG